jgi:DNA-binding response OmpR family regulator
VRIALLEDDIEQADIVKLWLEEASHSCKHYKACKAFLRELPRESFDLFIIDWLLPDGSGIDALGAIRRHVDWPAPVLFVTSQSREDDIVHALDKGADDYMVKPVRQRELLARVNALARRGVADNDQNQPLTLGPYRIEQQTQTITRSGEVITLTDKEFKLASLLFQNTGRLLSRDYLMEAVWGLNDPIPTRTLDTHVSNIRRKLGISTEVGLRIKTIYRHGYRLEELHTFS